MDKEKEILALLVEDIEKNTNLNDRGHAVQTYAIYLDAVTRSKNLRTKEEN